MSFVLRHSIIVKRLHLGMTQSSVNQENFIGNYLAFTCNKNFEMKGAFEKTIRKSSLFIIISLHQIKKLRT